MSDIRTDLPTTPGVPPYSRPQAAGATGQSPFVPMLLVAGAFAAWLGFQGNQLFVEKSQLAQAAAALAPQEQAATKIRASLDAIAGATAKLSAEGNPSARAIVDELRRRGVTIGPSAASAPAK